MRVPNPPAHRTAARLCAVALTAGVLVSCGSGLGGSPDLDTALAVASPEFESVSAGEPPTELCETGSSGGGGGGVPTFGSQLGTPTSVAYRSEEAELTAHAWTTPSPAIAEAVVDEVAAAAHECDYDLHYDADTDGDGQLDAGGSELQQAHGWSGSGWTGVAINTEFTGQHMEVRETRFVHADAVLLLVTCTDDTGDPAAVSTVDGFLREVADRLG